nr:FecR domain-containing protein [Paraburkholderia ferrariae]
MSIDRSMRPAQPRRAARMPQGAARGALAARYLGALICGTLAGMPGAQAHEASHAHGHGAAPAATVTYVTRPGDSLYVIANRYLRDPSDWVSLARLNHVSEPRHLQPGIALRVPVALLRQDGLAAKVIAANGPVTHAFRNAPSLPLVVGSSLVEGDRVQTGKDGFATLELADGTHLIIPPETSLELGTLRQTALTGTTDRIINLKQGEVDSEVTHATQKDDRFQIRSPSVVAGVRGTSFRVSYDGGNGSTAVEVLEGAVGVDAAHGGAGAPAPGTPLAASSELVAARHGSFTTAGGAVGSPVALLDAPDLEHPARVQDDASVAFDIAPVETARGYRVQIGRDAGLLEMIRDLRSDSAHADAGALPDGTYFVRITAIDQNGLEGMPNTYAFERRRLAFGTSAGRLDDTRNYAFRWFVDRNAANLHFRFVLATGPDLRVPLVDRTDIAGGEVVVSDLPKGVYYWTVIAEQFENGRYYQKASPVQSFRLDW